MSQCAACGAEFTPRRGAVTCSNACYMWAQKHPGQPRVTSRACGMCGSEFKVTTQAQKFCSPQCRAAKSKRRTGRTDKEYVRYSKCETCGGSMPEGSKAGTKYCSQACGLRDKKAERERTAALEDRNCCVCGETFHPKREGHVTCSRRCSKLAHYYANQAEYSARAVKWMADRPEWKSAQQNRRRVQKRGLDANVVLRDWERAVRKADGKCYYCGEPAKLTMEHVVPLSRGGKHTIGNLAPVCRRCNCSKKDLLLVEWRARKNGRRVRSGTRG